jgi:hypothetical protein
MAYPGMKAGGKWHVPFFDSLMALGVTSFAFDLGKTPTLVLNPDLTDQKIVWSNVVD